jgi:hypothetical protein
MEGGDSGREGGSANVDGGREGINGDDEASGDRVGVMTLYHGPSSLDGRGVKE